MVENPTLCYLGWRTPRLTVSEFHEERQRLANAWPEVALCLRVFSDPRFRYEYRGRMTAYRLKHVAESWNFEGKKSSLSDSHAYNGYVSQGSATAAALLLGFTVEQDTPISSNSRISI